ncbi:hypothetical protein MRX96_044190 [Rhipicephalus microplus]
MNFVRDDIDAVYTCTSRRNQTNADDHGADSYPGHEQGYPPIILNLAMLSETSTTFVQVPAPLVLCKAFTNVPEELMAFTTVLANSPEPLMLLRGHRLIECALNNKRPSGKLVQHQYNKVVLSPISKPVYRTSTTPKKPEM